MTKRIFDEFPYQTKANAMVISCEKTEKNNEIVYACVLDETIFFPEEGGQSPDKGTINGIEVIDVQVKDNVIIHYLREGVKEADTVVLNLDWAHRFSNMQQHSGEHIFSGTVHKLYGFDNVGFHLSDSCVTMDFNGVLNKEQLAKVEDIVNEAIAANVEIDAKYVDDETLSKLEYRSKKELAGPVRIVTVPGYDVCACCAPHVKRTGEIGILKIVHAMNYKGGVRVSILCGRRALDYYRESLELIESLTGFLTTGRENLASYVKKLKSDNMSLSSALMSAKGDLLKQELAGISSDLSDVVVFKEKMDSSIIRSAVNMLTQKHEGLVAFFSGSDEDGYSYILASKKMDVREVQKKLSEGFAAKGGGKSEMINGSVKAKKEDIEGLLKNIE